MKIPGNSNIFEFNANDVFEQFSTYIEGDANDILMAVSTYQLSDTAIQAFENSAERLGYGIDRISYVVIAKDTSAPSLFANDLKTIVTGIDPVAIILTDGGACTLFEQAYETTMGKDSFQRIACKNVIAFESFEKMLLTNDEKQRAWAILKNLSLG